MPEPAVGIDLGTTNSCVAVYRNDEVHIIDNESGSRLTPSYITFTEDGVLTGPEAVEEAHKYIKDTVFEAKRLIGQKFGDPQVQDDISRFPYEVFDDLGTPKIRITNGSEYYPEEISAYILRRMRAISESRLKTEVSKAVVTVPAYFNDSQRKATKDAAEIAGFKSVTIISEPTAAALAFNHQNPKDFKRNILVYDFGGGTFDVSIVNISKGKCEVKATKGDCHLGGTDIDNNIANYIKECFKQRHGKELDNSTEIRRRLINACEKAKKKLSGPHYETAIELDSLPGTNLNFTFSLSRARFEIINEELFEKTMQIVRACLQDSKLTPSDIDEVVLVGGSSRIAKIQEMLKEFFGDDKISKGVNPDEAVAYGAAIHVGNLSGNKLEVSDVTALSLGTNTYGDLFSAIIPRNTRIPTKAVKRYQTIMDGQTTMEFPIYQGERDVASENFELGNFTMTNLTEAPARGVKVEVSFEIDAEGLLHVTAEETNSQNRKQVTISVAKAGLTKEQIQQRLQEAERHRENDLKKRLFAEKKYQLEAVLHRASSHAKNCKQEDKVTIEDKCDEIYKWLDNITIEDVEKMEEFEQEIKDLLSDTSSQKSFM